MASKATRLAVGLALIAGAAGVGYVVWRAPERIVQPPSAMTPPPLKPASAPAPAPTPREIADLDLPGTRALLTRRSTVAPGDGAVAPALTRGQGYVTLVGGLSGGDGLARSLLDIHGRDVATVAITAESYLSDGRVLPPLALGWLTREAGTGGPFAAAKGNPSIATRPVRLEDAGAITVEVTIAFSTERARPEAAPAWSRTYPGASTLELPLAGGMPAARVRFKDAGGVGVGEVWVRAVVIPSLLGPNAAGRSLGDLLAVDLPGGGTVGGVLADTAAARLFAPGSAADDACDRIRGALFQGAGLSAFDAAVVLRALVARRAAVVGEGPAAATCLGRRMAAVLEAAGVPLVPASVMAGDSDALDNILDRLAGGLRMTRPERSLEQLSALLAPEVVLVDHGAVWLQGGGVPVLRGGGVDVVPAATVAQAAALMLELPVDHFACFSRGTAAAAPHRAALVALAADPGLWQLDIAFDAGHRVAGVALTPADQASACRASGARLDGPDACFFATTGRTYRGVDPGRC